MVAALFGRGCPQEDSIMAMPPVHADRDLDGKLIDVSHIPLRQLRVREDANLIRAMQQVVAHATQMPIPSASAGGGSGGTKRLD
jgi:hypothetical protein